MPALQVGDGGFKSPTRYLGRNSKNQIPNPNGRGVRRDLVLEIWRFVHRRVCGCGHRVGLKNRRRWFDSNTLHWESESSNLRSQISSLSRSSSRLRTLAPQAGNAGFEARTRHFQEIPNHKIQAPRSVKSWFGIWFLVLGGFWQWVVILTAACKAVVVK